MLAAEASRQSPQRPAPLKPLPPAAAGGTAAAARPAAAALGTVAAGRTARARWRVVEHGAVLSILVGQHPLQGLSQVDPLDFLRLDPAVRKLADIAQLP